MSATKSNNRNIYNLPIPKSPPVLSIPMTPEPLLTLEALMLRNAPNPDLGTYKTDLYVVHMSSCLTELFDCVLVRI